MAAGFVSLVGAGPGDPELLTRKAVRRLERADLVLYDALVPEEMLALAPRATRVFVGKRAGRAAMRQEAINALMIRAARRGRHVVRLKCGDPFVLGRGGEEALALRMAGIPFEVVPGVTSAVAAPALAGIPVTHRGLASGFVVISGHAEAAYGPALDGIAPNTLTIVTLMGLRHRSALAARLLERGWARSTPAAVIFAASTPDADVWVGSLGELETVELDETGAPGTIVIGSVVSLSRIIGQEVPLESERLLQARQG